MRKIIILSIVLSAVSYINMNAQNSISDAKSFLSKLNYTISVGYSSRVSNEPFDKARFGLTFGVDAKKYMKSYLNDKVNMYGLVGLHYVQKGGKQSTDVMDLVEAGNDFGVSQFSIPIHVGGTYNFSKCQLFLDLGPYLAFGIGGTDDIEGLETKAFDFGLGFNFGIKFKKRFGLSVGYDKGFTKIAEYEVTTANNPTGDLKLGDKYSLKGMAAYFRLQWTFGKN